MPVSEPAPLVSGLGVCSAIGQGQQAFSQALLAGAQRFAPMRRPGRQRPAPAGGSALSYLGAEIEQLQVPAELPARSLRTASLSAQVAVTTLHEAWADAALDGIDPLRIGLVVGGSNLQQRELVCQHEHYRGREAFLRPTYGLSFMDSDLCGLATELFPIRGFAHTLGSASASGQVAVIEAMRAVHSGRVDICIALGGLMDLSYWECQGLRSLGAMGSDRYASEPTLACRPFDRDRDGFIYGESCAAVVVESELSLQQRCRSAYARLSGWGLSLDGNRNPNPSVEGELAAIAQALSRAGVEASQVDYLNPHGTGSPLGDVTELEALRRAGLHGVRLNTTKSITGHGLSAAGAVELVAVLLQMRAGKLHPCRNLEHPIDADFDWVGVSAEPHPIRTALNLSMGFGGINSAVCIQAV
jgi:malonyl-ACP decarboxylase